MATTKHTQPLGIFLNFFWPVTEHMGVWGDPGGSGSAEKYICKISYYANFEIGTQVPQGGSQETFFF